MAGDESGGVVAHRRRKHRADGTGLDQPCMAEDGNPVDEAGSERDIMGYEEQRHAVLAHQPVEQADDLGLDDDIEGTRRLVGDQQRRLGSDCCRDRHALALAAGKLMRKGPQRLPGLRHPYPFQQFLGPDGGLFPAKPKMTPGAFGDLFSDRQDGIEARARILEDEAEIAARAGRMAERGPEHFAGDFRSLGQQTGQRPGERALAGAAFTDDCQPFARGDIEINAVESGGSIVFVAPIGDRELSETAEDVAHAPLPPSSPSALPRPSLKR
ncbi:hypothetical protein RHECNPAF_930026 [Rhizobium etli CNPAF512]|nr:hypothetical protein RHECNPAF_930026 [Rhizobium etli CNPAF512]